jgi:phage tail-like protein
MAVPSFSPYSKIARYGNIPGVRVDPLMGYNFLVEIGGIIGGGFTEISGLESSVELEQYKEGGVNGYAHQLPGQVTYPPLQLTHGLTNLDFMWDWYWLTTQNRPLLLNGTIMLLNNLRIPVMWWNFKEAYPVKWVGPRLNASNDSQAAVEQLDLVHRGIIREVPPPEFLAMQRAGAIATDVRANITGFPL